MGFYIQHRADEVANWLWKLTLDVLVNNLGKACDLNKTAKTKSEGGKKGKFGKEIGDSHRRVPLSANSFKRETKKNGGKNRR